LVELLVCKSGILNISHQPTHPGEDPASKIRGDDFSDLLVKPPYRFTVVRGTKYTSQHCCDKIMGVQWPYIVNAVFRIVQNHGE